MSCKQPRLAAGRLRQFVTIKTPTTPTDGETTPSFATLTSDDRAEVKAASGSESLRGDQMEATVSTVVTMHYRTDLTPRMQIIHGSRTLEIVATFDPDGQQRETVCHCKEVD